MSLGRQIFLLAALGGVLLLLFAFRVAPAVFPGAERAAGPVEAGTGSCRIMHIPWSPPGSALRGRIEALRSTLAEGTGDGESGS